MVNIDAIMALLDWNNSTEQQERGIELAKDVKCINVFLQPNQREYGKNGLQKHVAQSARVREECLG